MNEKIQGVYRILNTINGKCYIGSSVNIKARWRSHRTAMRAKTSECVKLQRAWNKYGEQSFSFNIVEIISGNKEELYKREQYYIDFYDSVRRGYNILFSAGSCAGCKLSDKTKSKMSEAHKIENLSDETRFRMSESHKRENLNEETRRKLSESAKKRWGNLSAREKQRLARTGRTATEEARKNMSNAQTGKTLSDETKDKIALARIGKKHSKESIDKMSGENNHNYGKTHTPEARAKMSAANIGKVISPETKAKMSASAKKRWADKKALKTAS